MTARTKFNNEGFVDCLIEDTKLRRGEKKGLRATGGLYIREGRTKVSEPGLRRLEVT